MLYLYCERETSAAYIPSFPFAATDSSARALVFMPVHGISLILFKFNLQGAIPCLGYQVVSIFPAVQFHFTGCSVLISSCCLSCFRHNKSRTLLKKVQLIEMLNNPMVQSLNGILTINFLLPSLLWSSAHWWVRSQAETLCR